MMKILKAISILLISWCATQANASIAPVADFLVWHTSEESAATWANVASGLGTQTVKFRAPNVQFDWDLGFRGGLIYNSQQDIWDTSLLYTYFQAKTTSSISNALQLVFPEFFSGFISQNFFFGGNLNWRLQMNMLDYDFGYKLKFGNDIVVRPAIGLKGGTIYQTINTVWNAVVYTANEQSKNNFTGLGPSFSIATEWQALKNLSLFGNISTAFLWGNWDLSDVYTRPFVSGVVTATTITTTLNNTQLGTKVFGCYFGFEWHTNAKPGISLQVGYEAQIWINQLRMLTFQQLPVHGDLTLQGATCRVILDL